MKDCWIGITPFIEFKTKNPNIFLRIILKLLGMKIIYKQKPYDCDESVVNLIADDKFYKLTKTNNKNEIQQS